MNVGGRHQDYMLRPPVIDRAQLHIHVFFYFNGLDGTVGDLMVLPGSQYSYWDSLTLRQTFKDTPLPGSKVFDSLPNGSAVIAHSGLVHGRRQKPGGEAHPRYFVDISYCQPGEYASYPLLLTPFADRRMFRRSFGSALACFETATRWEQVHNEQSDGAKACRAKPGNREKSPPRWQIYAPVGRRGCCDGGEASCSR